MPKPRSEEDNTPAAESSAEIATTSPPPSPRASCRRAKLREEALCRLYSVSRTKIRAALLILSKEKLIDIIPDKGAFVSEPTEAESREIFAVRRIIEAALAREFVAKARPADYRMLERHLKMERNALSGNDSKVRSKLLGDFHVLLAEVVGNHVLKEILRELVGRSSLITMLYQADRDAICSSDEHLEFLEIAKSGDADKAVQSLLEHLNHVEAALNFGERASDRKKNLVSALLA